MNTQKKKEREKKVEDEERTRVKKKKVCDGSDIFTQLPHTNRTTEGYTRIYRINIC
jgi:hypothetical protein